MSSEKIIIWKRADKPVKRATKAGPPPASRKASAKQPAGTAKAQAAARAKQAASAAQVDAANRKRWALELITELVEDGLACIEARRMTCAEAAEFILSTPAGAIVEKLQALGVSMSASKLAKLLVAAQSAKAEAAKR